MVVYFSLLSDLSVDEASLFWSITESLLRDSKDCCEAFVKADGVKHLIKSMRLYSSDVIDTCVKQIISHILTESTLSKALLKQDFFNHLMWFAYASPTKQQKV